MQAKEFLHLQLLQYLLRWRWLLPLPIGLLIGYWAYNTINLLNSSAAPINASLPGQLSGNALEAFIWAFGKPEIVYFVASVLFIYLVSDLLPELPFGQALVFRLKSRSIWWFAKVCTMFIATLLYCGLLFGAFFIPVASRLPFSTHWSPASLNDFGMGIGLFPKNKGPLEEAGWIALLLFLGWFSIGLLIMTVNQLTQRNWMGFITGASLIVCGCMGLPFTTAINQSGWAGWLLLWNHLEYTPLWTPIREMPLSTTFAFWGIWGITCFVIGLVSSKRQDILNLNE